jgi:hypothetical protein
MGSAPTLGAVFRALAENISGVEFSGGLKTDHASNAGREGAVGDARGGRAPRDFELKRKRLLVFHPEKLLRAGGAADSVKLR